MGFTRIVIAAAALLFSTLPSTSVPSAESEPCPHVEVVFARGTAEPVGVGQIGQQFVDALRSQTTRTVSEYPVNYLASSDFNDPMAFAKTRW